MVIRRSSVYRRLTDEVIEDLRQASKSGKGCPLKHGKVFVAQVRHQH
jgi:hypothetical protein